MADDVLADEKEASLEIESVKIAEDKAEAEAALEEALPALEEAAQALSDLKKDDITELRSLPSPTRWYRTSARASCCSRASRTRHGRAPRP